MAEQTTSSIVIDAPPEAVMDVIADFESYPQWAHGVKKAEVVEPGSDPSRPDRVYFELDATAVKDQYTLSYDWSEQQVTWQLVEGKMLKAMDGAYVLRPRGEGSAQSTEVTYRLKVDISIPMIGMMKRKAEKVIVDTALKGLKKRVEGRG
ncbi:SRPBCC family protein [Nocardioidaceae bacterium]|nr:SRPBCC family protein [Nocardioidaceae bacterium]